MIVTRASFLLRRLALAGVLGVVVTCSCSNDPCDGLKIGDQIAITVVKAAYADGGEGYYNNYYNCNFGFDVAQGQVLQGAVVNESSQGQFCGGSTVTIAPFGTWSWTLTSTAATPDYLIAGTYTASSGSCSGTVTLSILGYGSPLDMVRDFEPTGPGTSECHSCVGDFTVSIQKLSGP